MRKHTAAIKTIRATIKELAAEKPKLRAEILALKYNERGERRPETGPTRHSMKEGYGWATRPIIRANLLAYGLLRGCPRKTMEPKYDDQQNGYLIPKVLKALHDAIGDNEELKAEWPMERVCRILVDGIDPAASQEVAA